MLIEEITIKNLLSFGPKGVTLPMRPLNVLIGPNGSGKSNFIDVIGFLQALPRDAWGPMRKGRSFDAWAHRELSGGSENNSQVSVKWKPPYWQGLLVHNLSFALEIPPTFIGESIVMADSDSVEVEQRTVFERVEGASPTYDSAPSHPSPLITTLPLLKNQSIIRQLDLIVADPVLIRMERAYSSIHLYRDWDFGRSSPIRSNCSTAVMAESVDEDWSNFIAVLNEIQGIPSLKKELVERIQDLYQDVTDFHVQIAQDNMILWLYESDRKVPASRLSDGTVRYMCLLAILLNPNPPPLVCIEEPELGLHPDLVVRVADLLKEASTRMQLVVTTHSDILLDALSDTPESVVVCSKEEGETVMTRLNADDLRPYLEEQTLSSLWNSGQLGGRRW